MFSSAICDKKGKKENKENKEVTLDEFRDFMMNIESEIPIFDEKVDTREKYTTMTTSIEAWYEKSISAEPQMKFTNPISGCADYLVQQRGILHDDIQNGVCSIGISSFNHMVNDGFRYPSLKHMFNCRVRKGKIDGYVNFASGIKVNDSYYLIDGTAKNGQLDGYCIITELVPPEQNSCVIYGGVFQMGIIMDGTVTTIVKEKDDGDKKNVSTTHRQCIPGEFTIKLPDYNFSLQNMTVIKPIYHTTSNSYVWRDNCDCYCDDYSDFD